jgi:hypothetical protein
MAFGSIQAVMAQDDGTAARQSRDGAKQIGLRDTLVRHEPN